MNSIIKVLSVLLIVTLLCACGASNDTAPTGTKAPASATPESKPASEPAETTSPYPTPDKLIALTFDDGPNTHMGTILDVLAEYDAKASFYVIGKKLDNNNSEYVLRAFQEGHEIGNHSDSHPYMTKISESKMHQELDGCSVKLLKILPF